MRQLTESEILLAEGKISRMSRRFLTTDQKMVFDKYREQYRHMRERYRKDFDYRIKTDLVLLVFVGLIIAIGFFSTVVYLIFKVNEL